MHIRFLGTGSSGGVPLYGCHCAACDSARNDVRLIRRPCTALVEAKSTKILVDAGLMDLHERFPSGNLSAILLTHFHPDHVQGLFHLRWGEGKRISVYAPEDAEGCADLYKHPGLLDFQVVKVFKSYKLGCCLVTPLPLLHSKPTFGYAIESPNGDRFAYLTDTLDLPESTAEFLNEWGGFDLALDCTYPPMNSPRNHNDLSTALTIIASVNPDNTWLTHISHEHDAWRHSHFAQLSAAINYSYDGLRIHVKNGKYRQATSSSHLKPGGKSIHLSE